MPGFGPAELLFALLAIGIPVALLIVAWKVAEGKNRSGVLWVMLVLLFTLPALVVLLLLPALPSSNYSAGAPRPPGVPSS
jgi:heme/copper-type cytochrome/quinol oxidase subunit 2